MCVLQHASHVMLLSFLEHLMIGAVANMKLASCILKQIVYEIYNFCRIIVST